MAVLRYFHQDPRQTSVQESSVIDKQGTVLTQKLTTINQSITNNTQVLEDKLNSVPGKSLSTNDFTDEYKNKLRGIEEGAEVNVQSDWGEDDNTADSYIKNKPVIDDIVTQNSENLITSGAVFTAIDELPEPMIFKGSLGTGGTIQTLPAPSADNVGFVYKVITAGTYYGITAKPGDTFISDGSDWILIPSGDEPEGTVMSVGLTVPTGLLVSGSPITTSGTLAITYALGYAIPTTAKLDEWDAKQNAISDLSTIRSNASNGNTAYGWGNHANAGYVKSSGVTSVAMTVPTGLSISGSPITSTGTLALSFANGYSIPTTAKLSNWDTAYGWGNHASAGYLTGITKAMVTTALGYTPPQQDTNTTYSIATGDSNGQIKVTPSSGNAYNVSVKGLGSRAYDSTSYLPLAGGTMSGDITMPTTKAFYGILGDFSTTTLSDVGGLSWKNLSGKQSSSVNVYDTPSTADTWWYILRNRHTNTGNNYYTDVAIPFNANGIYYKRINNGSIVNNTIKNGWIAVLDELNSSVSLSGSTLTVKINGVEKSLTNTNTTYSAGSGLSLSGTTFSLALTKALVTTALGYTPPTTDTNTWRGITDSYSGTDSSISLSQKGGNALYNALVNGYASSAGNADTVDGLHASSFVIDHGGDTTGKIYDIGSKRIFSGITISDGPVSSGIWMSGLVLGSNWNNNHYQHYLVESGDRWYTTRSYSNGSMTNWKTFAYTSEIPTNYLPRDGSNYATWLRIINNSSNNTDDALVFILNKNSNDWALKVDCTGYNYGINVMTSDNASHAIYTNGRINCYSLKFMNTADVASGWNIYTEGYGLRILDATGSSDRGAPSNYYSTALHVGGQYWFLLAFERGNNRLLYRGGNAEGVTRSWSRIHTYGDNEYACVGKMYIQCDTDDSHVIIGAPYKSDETAGPWVGIGKVNPSYKLHVNGACGATSFPNTSDIRLKDILSDWLPKLEDIANAPSFLFKWNNIKDDTVHLGSSAQYWEEKVPNVVTEANDEIKTKSLQYDVLGTVNSIAIAKEVVSLKEEIKLLQALIAELKLLLNN